jgi:hypothetical protein
MLIIRNAQGEQREIAEHAKMPEGWQLCGVRVPLTMMDGTIPPDVHIIAGEKPKPTLPKSQTLLRCRPGVRLPRGAIPTKGAATIKPVASEVQPDDFKKHVRIGATGLGSPGGRHLRSAGCTWPGSGQHSGWT